jgi:DNA-binding protein HU-beta
MGFSNMNKTEFIEAIATKTGCSKADANRTVGALIEIISDTLQKGDSLSLPGFGSFEVRERAERTGRNPRTGEELKIAASRIPAFKPGATLKAAVNGAGKK